MSSATFLLHPIFKNQTNNNLLLLIQYLFRKHLSTPPLGWHNKKKNEQAQVMSMFFSGAKTLFCEFFLPFDNTRKKMKTIYLNQTLKMRHRHYRSKKKRRVNFWLLPQKLSGVSGWCYQSVSRKKGRTSAFAKAQPPHPTHSHSAEFSIFSPTSNNFLPPNKGESRPPSHPSAEPSPPPLQRAGC